MSASGKPEETSLYKFERGRLQGLVVLGTFAYTGIQVFGEVTRYFGG